MHECRGNVIASAGQVQNHQGGGEVPVVGPCGSGRRLGVEQKGRINHKSRYGGERCRMGLVTVGLARNEVFFDLTTTSSGIDPGNT